MPKYFYKAIKYSSKREEEVKIIIDTFFEKLTENENQLLKVLLEREDAEDKENISIEKRDDYAEKVCEAYYAYLEFFKRKILLPPDGGDKEAKVNISKIISGLELAIVNIKPLKVDGNLEATHIVNAHLAFFCAITFLTGWHEDRYPNIIKWEQNVLEDLDEFVNEHIKWLIMLNPQAQYPYMSNAQTWRILYLLLIEKSKNEQNN